MKSIITLFVLSAMVSSLSAAPEHYIKVHFIYGSKPKPEFKNTESPWFGGIHGGHVGIEFEANKVFHFERKGKLRMFPKPRCSENSQFAIQSLDSFYGHFGSSASEVKKTFFIIPIKEEQYQTLCATIKRYIEHPPYNYALFGMRCASATSDLLEEILVFKDRSRFVTCVSTLYPKTLRNKLFRKAENEHWEYQVIEGSVTRKWEKDKAKIQN